MRFLNNFLCTFVFTCGGMVMAGYALAKPVVLIASPEVIAIPIIENHDPMVNVKDTNDLVYGPSPEVPNNIDYTKMRKTVYQKLLKAQTMLPQGLHFCLYEAYRSVSLQKKLFDTRFTELKQKHPGWSKEHLFNETTKLVSPVINIDGTKNIPPHSTGGAIDVYLLNDKNEVIDMGIHPKDWMSDTDGSLSLTASNKISDGAKFNRKIMSHALESLGFVNYPTEYWHWSYGDRYWAYHQHKNHALYNNALW